VTSRTGTGTQRRVTPVPIGILAAVAVGFLAIPLLGVLLRTPWARLPEILTSPVALEALRLSLVASLSATAIAVVLGLPLAWVLARARVPGLPLVRALVTLPLVLPPVVGGVALLIAFGRRGIIGQYLYDWWGIQLPFTTAGVIMAEAFVAMPFLIITVEGALRSADRRYEDAAATLGASRWMIMRRITLPLIAPAVVAGTVLAWARALGEFGATITFVSNIPGETQTLPSAIYTFIQVPGGDAGALRLTLISIAISLAALMVSEWLAARASRRVHAT
jgi:molybdate transport system permease protein